MLVYHTFLIGTNQTTWECERSDSITYLQIYPKNERRPFSEGIAKNLARVLCHDGKPR